MNITIEENRGMDIFTIIGGVQFKLFVKSIWMMLLDTWNWPFIGLSILLYTDFLPLPDGLPKAVPETATIIASVLVLGLTIARQFYTTMDKRLDNEQKKQAIRKAQIENDAADIANKTALESLRRAEAERRAMEKQLEN